jgi:hypothetical protein
MHLYVFGNGNLSFQSFLELYAEPLDRLLHDRLQHDRELRVLVCDFRGVDTLVMEYLKCSTANVRVYHVGERPRYLPDAFRTQVSRWELVGGFSDDGARDAAAIVACTHFLAHDFNSDAKRKSGTLRNIERCLELGKTRLLREAAPASGP